MIEFCFGVILTAAVFGWWNEKANKKLEKLKDAYNELCIENWKLHRQLNKKEDD